MKFIENSLSWLPVAGVLNEMAHGAMSVRGDFNLMWHPNKNVQKLTRREIEREGL